MSMTLQCKESGDFQPHPEGIHPAVCVDLIDLGLVPTEFQGETKLVHKVKAVFESEARMADGRPFTVSKSFTMSMHPKAKLNEFVSKWRGRPVLPGETIVLEKMIGASCTLVISHQQNRKGYTYAAIDAVSKPTKKVTASGAHDPAAARQRIAEWKAKQAGTAAAHAPAAPAPAPAGRPAWAQPAAPAPTAPPPAGFPGEDDVPF